MLVMGLIVLLSNNMTMLAGAEDEKKAAEQLTAFNREYESYNKQVLRGSEVITVINKAMENNKALKNDSSHPEYIEVRIYLLENEVRNKVTLKSKTYHSINDLTVRNFFNASVEEDYPAGLKMTGYFSCEKMQYDKNGTGRINLIIFKQNKQ